MKKTIIMALMAVASVSASAQQKQTIEIPSWLSNVKLSGYGMTQYQYSGQKDAESNSFNIRMARISLEGRISRRLLLEDSDSVQRQHLYPRFQSENGGSVCRMAEI